MCGIVGFVNYKQDVSRFRNILINMNNTLVRRGPDEDGYYIRKHIALAHKRLIVIDPEGGKQPMVESCSKSIPLQKENSDMVINYNSNFVISYNGQIYNTDELRKTLEENGFTFNGHCDTEILLKSYIFYGKDVVKHLNGIYAFAIWDSQKEELFIARDHFGVKPLFYTMQNNSFIFASEIKAIFQYPSVEKILDSQGISELFGIGPAHTPGTTIFNNIFELKPAHFLIYNRSGIHIEKYWNLRSEPHTENFTQTCEHLEYLLKDSITRQLVSDVPLCTFLSGGLDSSIITKFASDYCQENNLPPLDTYSIDYIDNDKNFVKSDFQPNSDNYYINLMVSNLKTNHHSIVLDTPELADSLYDAMIARDMPGMADIDSSLLLFCKNVKKQGETAGLAVSPCELNWLYCPAAFCAKRLSTSRSKSTHWSGVSSPAWVMTVSSRSRACCSITGVRFQASISRCRAHTRSRTSRSVSGNWSQMASATWRPVCSATHCWARAMALTKPWTVSGFAST